MSTPARLSIAAIVITALVAASPAPALAQTVGVNGPSSSVDTARDAGRTQQAMSAGDVLAVAFAIYMVGHCSSPWENGFGFRGGVLVPLSQTRHLSLFPNVTYDNLYIDGDQDRFLQVGVQLRRAPDRPGLQKHGFWYGPEVSVGKLKEIFTGGSDSTTGYLLGGATGIRLLEWAHGVLDLSGTVGYTHFGDSGIQTRVGVEWRSRK